MLYYTVEYTDPAVFLEDYGHLKHAGLMLEMNELPPLSTEIEVELRLPPEQRSMFLQGRVILHSGNTAILQFENLSSQQQVLLQQSHAYCQNIVQQGNAGLPKTRASDPAVTTETTNTIAPTSSSGSHNSVAQPSTPSSSRFMATSSPQASWTPPPQTAPPQSFPSSGPTTPSQSSMTPPYNQTPPPPSRFRATVNSSSSSGLPAVPFTPAPMSSPPATPPPTSSSYEHDELPAPTPPLPSRPTSGGFISANPMHHKTPPPMSAVPEPKPTPPPMSGTPSGGFISANPSHHKTPPPASVVPPTTPPPRSAPTSGGFISANPSHHKTPPPMSAVPSSQFASHTPHSGTFISANPTHHKTPPPMSAVPQTPPPMSAPPSGGFISANPSDHRTPPPMSAVPQTPPPATSPSPEYPSSSAMDLPDTTAHHGSQPGLSLTPPPPSSPSTDSHTGISLTPPPLPGVQSLHAQQFQAPSITPQRPAPREERPSWTGHIAQTSLFSALSQLSGHNATGTLHVYINDDQDLQCYLNKGRILAVVPKPVDEATLLGELLVQAEMIQASQRDIALTKLEGKEVPLGDYLREQVWISKKQLAEMLRTQMYLRLRPFLSIEEGSFAFWEQRRPEGNKYFSPPTAPLKLIFRGAMDYFEQEPTEASQEFESNYNSRYLFRSDATAEQWEALQLNQEESTFLDNLATGKYRLRELYTASRMRRRKVYAFLRALHELSMVRFEAEQNQEFKIQEMLEKFQSRHALVGGDDIYEFIGLTWTASNEDLQEAMKRVKTQYDLSRYEGEWPEELQTMSNEILEKLKKVRKQLSGRKRPIPKKILSSPAEIKSAIKLLEEQADMAVYRRSFAKAIEYFSRILDLVPKSAKHKKKLDACKAALQQQRAHAEANKGKDIDFAESMKVDLSSLGFDDES